MLELCKADEEPVDCLLYEVGHFGYAVALLNLVCGAVSIPVEALGSGRRGHVVVVSRLARELLKKKQRGTWRQRLKGLKRLRV